MKKIKRKVSRRANGEGSIFQRKDGYWVGSITNGFDENGKQRKKTVYGKSRIAVQNKLSMYSTRIKNNSFDLLENETVDELMMNWLIVFKRNTITPSTYVSNLTLFKYHIKPFIENLHIHEIDEFVIQQTLNKMIEEDYSLSTIKKVKFIYNQFLDFAVESGWIVSNPSHKIKVRIKNKTRYSGQNRYKAIPPDRREEFLKALDKDPRNYLKYLCYTLMFGGLRIGEALGLQWKNVSLKNKTLNIVQSASLIPQITKEQTVSGYKTQIGNTKSVCSVREIPIPDILVEKLFEWYEKQKEKSNNSNINYIAPEQFVFCTEEGKLRTYSCCRLAYNRFKRANKKNKMKDLGVSFHGLRHTFSNILFEAKENPKVIQQLLGHRDVGTTISVYNSVDKDYIRKSSDTFNSQFKPQNPEFFERIEKEIGEQEEDEIYDSYSDEELDELIKRIERAKKRKENDIEM